MGINHICASSGGCVQTADAAVLAGCCVTCQRQPSHVAHVAIRSTPPAEAKFSEAQTEKKRKSDIGDTREKENLLRKYRNIPTSNSPYTTPALLPKVLLQTQTAK